MNIAARIVAATRAEDWHHNPVVRRIVAALDISDFEKVEIPHIPANYWKWIGVTDKGRLAEDCLARYREAAVSEELGFDWQDGRHPRSDDWISLLIETRHVTQVIDDELERRR